MQDLRIVGRDENSEPIQLLLSDDAGHEFRVPIDKALRSAVMPEQSALPQHRPEPKPLAPREIQARIRSGSTIEAVMEASGLSREHVLRYAGPVIDERAYIASQARGTIVNTASAAAPHRLAFGDSPATLEAMVRVRLRSMDIEHESVAWDSYRREDGSWTISCSFDVNSSSTYASGIGTKPPAQWAFEPTRRVLTPMNKWAESLWTMPDDLTQGGRRLAPVEEPFDVDFTHRRRPRNPPAAPTTKSAATAESAPGSDAEDLLDMLRARRGQRLGTDEAGDDKLATMLTRNEQPTPRSSGSTTLTPVSAPAGSASSADEAHRGAQATSADPEDRDAWGFSYSDDRPESGAAEKDAANGSGNGKDGSGQSGSAKRGRRSKRPAMPRWDDILFGGSKD